MKRWPFYAVMAILFAVCFSFFARYDGHNKHCEDLILLGVAIDVLSFCYCTALAIHLHWWENLGR